MPERDIGHITGQKGDYEFRSLLLMPVMQGHTLDSEDVSSFLGVRLSGADDESPQEQD
jgi:hypothetical protein